MKKQLFFIFSLLILFLVSIHYYLRENITITDISCNQEENQDITPAKQPQDHTEVYAQLKQEEDAIWQELATLGLSREHFEQEHKQLYPMYLEAGGNFASGDVTKQTKLFIQDVLKQIAIDPSNIEIYNFSYNMPAASTDRHLYVNESIFNGLAKTSKTFIIAHEVQHILHKDHSTRFIIGHLLGTRTQTLANEGAINHPLLKLVRFQEKRADIEAALCNKDLCLMFYDFAQEQLQLIGDTTGLTHPKTSERLKIAQNLATHMNISQSNLSAA